jgi:hypothetical protein
VRPQRINGRLVDIPPAIRCFAKYDHNTRANLMASHRQGHVQRHRVGEFFWIHPLVPGIAFPTRKAALLAALEKVAA